MKLLFVPVALVALATGTASAAKIDANLVPDGSYRVRVEKVVDGAHATVLMENGVEIDIAAAKHTVVFPSTLTNARIRIYIVQGEVVALDRV